MEDYVQNIFDSEKKNPCQVSFFEFREKKYAILLLDGEDSIFQNEIFNTLIWNSFEEKFFGSAKEIQQEYFWLGKHLLKFIQIDRNCGKEATRETVSC